jgi:hypothetical protein
MVWLMSTMKGARHEGAGELVQGSAMSLRGGHIVMGSLPLRVEGDEEQFRLLTLDKRPVESMGWADCERCTSARAASLPPSGHVESHQSPPPPPPPPPPLALRKQSCGMGFVSEEGTQRDLSQVWKVLNEMIWKLEGEEEREH